MKMLINSQGCLFRLNYSAQSTASDGQILRIMNPQVLSGQPRTNINCSSICLSSVDTSTTKLTKSTSEGIILNLMPASKK